MIIAEWMPILILLFIFLVIVALIGSIIVLTKKNSKRKETNIKLNVRIGRLEKEVEEIKSRLD